MTLRVARRPLVVVQEGMAGRVCRVLGALVGFGMPARAAGVLKVPESTRGTPQLRDCGALSLIGMWRVSGVGRGPAAGPKGRGRPAPDPGMTRGQPPDPGDTGRQDRGWRGAQPAPRPGPWGQPRDCTPVVHGPVPGRSPDLSLRSTPPSRPCTPGSRTSERVRPRDPRHDDDDDGMRR